MKTHTVITHSIVGFVAGLLDRAGSMRLRDWTYELTRDSGAKLDGFDVGVEFLRSR